MFPGSDQNLNRFWPGAATADEQTRDRRKPSWAEKVLAAGGSPASFLHGIRYMYWCCQFYSVGSHPRVCFAAAAVPLLHVLNTPSSLCSFTSGLQRDHALRSCPMEESLTMLLIDAQAAKGSGTQRPCALDTFQRLLRTIMTRWVWHMILGCFCSVD